MAIGKKKYFFKRLVPVIISPVFFKSAEADAQINRKASIQ